MNIFEATRSVWTLPFDFRGRAQRSEYWWWVLISTAISLAALLVDEALGGGRVVYIVAAIVLFVPTLAVTVRRLHDTGRSGLTLLIGIVPLVGVLILIVFTLQDSHSYNRYGANPKSPDDQATLYDIR